MEPEDSPIFSAEEKEQLFPSFERGESLMQEEPPFDYGTFYQNHANRTIFEEFGFLSERGSSSFEKFSEHCKSINGLQGFVTLGERHKGENMLDKASSEEINLPQFFDEPPPVAPLEKHIAKLRSDFAEVSPQLPGNFENFLYIEETNKHRLFEDVRQGYFAMLKQCAKKKQPETILLQLFEFWLGCFRDMLAAIEKCSPLYTLNLFKKEKDNRFIEAEEELPPSNIYQDEQPTERKKLWSQQELARLGELINNRVTLSSSVVQQLAVEFGRSPVAVQTRLQKLQRERRETSTDYEHKLIQVLKTSNRGMTKDVIAARLREQFKINDETFKKVIYPLLGASRNILKTKGIYSLISLPSESDNLNNFKNRVIACLLELPNRRGDLKSITRKYLEKFARDEGINPEDSERLKTVEANINKTLHRYECFDTSQSKTIYRFVERYDTESVFSSSDWSETELRKT